MGWLHSKNNPCHTQEDRGVPGKDTQIAVCSVFFGCNPTRRVMDPPAEPQAQREAVGSVFTCEEGVTWGGRDGQTLTCLGD